MRALYIASGGEAAGKSTLCWGIGRQLINRGTRVGYFKPLSLAEETAVFDRDAEFAKQVLNLEESARSLCPFPLNLAALRAELREPESLQHKMKEACNRISPGKETMLVEGIGTLDEGGALAMACEETAQALDARAIIVARYSASFPGEKLMNVAKNWKQRLLGMVVNAVPQKILKSETEKINSRFASEGIKVLGVLPEERLLIAITLKDLAEHLQGEILFDGQEAEELIENIMIAASSPDSGLEYFNRKANKAVIVRGNSPDLQLAALETQTRALILTGNKPPIDLVRYRAEERKVPLLLVKQDTLSTVAAIEEAIVKTRFRQQRKLERLEEILAQHFDFPALYQGLGLAA